MQSSDTTYATDNITACAACGKDGDGLKKCVACMMVKYCSRECQIAHRPQHKKACKKRAAELYDEKLFKEVEPDECPICMLPLPNTEETTTKSCCGKLICSNGCICSMVLSEEHNLCPFCRTPAPTSDDEEIKRTKNLMDMGSANGWFLLAGYYAQGRRGMTRDHQKANECMLKAGELGCAQANANLGEFYRDGILGVEVDKKKAKQYLELAAMMGHTEARYNEYASGNKGRAYKHMMISARAGYKKALDLVKIGYEQGYVTKDEYANTLRSYYQSRQDEMKSDMRDMAVATGMFGRG